MSGRPLIDMVRLNLRVPRGIDGFWKIIREMDETGAWTITEVANRTNVHKRNVSGFIQGLVAAGIARQVGSGTPNRGLPGAVSYRLARRPMTTPRLTLDGLERPETAIEVLWRTMKLAKAFTAYELAELASTRERPISPETTRRYLRDLAQVGVLSRAGSGRAIRYRLVRNLGARAPKILQAHVVFDPNANVVLGEAEAREVSP